MAGEIREILPPDSAAGVARDPRAAAGVGRRGQRGSGRSTTCCAPVDTGSAGAFEEGGTQYAVAAAGFRTGENLPWGRFLYIDDLSTLPAARGRGNAGALLAWLDAEAARLRLRRAAPGLGVQLERRDAHSLYLGSGYAITSHHFARPVSGA